MKSRVLAFSKEDLLLLRQAFEQPGDPTVWRSFVGNCEPLAVNLSAAEQAKAFDLQPILPGSLVTDVQVERIRFQAEEALQALQEEYAQVPGKTRNWVREDAYRLRVVLQEIFSAIAVGTGLLKTGRRNILSLTRTMSPDLCKKNPAYIPTRIWQGMFPDSAQSLAILAESVIPPYPPQGTPVEKAPKGALVFAFIAFELFRHLPMLQQTAREAKRPVVVCLFDILSDGTSYANAEKILSGAGITFLRVPSRLHTNIDVPSKCFLAESAVRHIPFAESLSDYWGMLEHWRWEELEAQLRWWETALPILEPSGVVVTCDNLVPEALLPAEAARQLGVPTVGIPHAYVVGSISHYCAKVQDASATGSDFQAKWWHRKHQPLRAGAFMQLQLINEYPCTRVSTEKSEKTVLFVHVPAEFPNTFSWVDEPIRKSISLRELEQKLVEAEADLRILHKVHPGAPELEIFSLAEVPLERILPADSEFAAAVSGVLASVSYNYFGSPFIQSMRHHRPAILFFTGTYGRAFSVETRGQLEESGLLVTDKPDALVEWIAMLRHDPAFFRSVVERQDRFYAENFADVRTDWSAWLESTVTELRGEVKRRRDE